MKAYTLKQNGTVENLVKKELPIPAISPQQVLVKVKAISINPVDAYVRASDQGLQRYILPSNGEDVIVGWDIAGIVEKTGEAVTAFKRGDAVFGLNNFPGHGKGYSEFVAADASHLALKPDNITFEQAAGATLAALTAWQSLVGYAKVQEGDHVLIHSAAGGVGHYAVQIAKKFGAQVTAVGSTKNKKFILDLGADRFIDYTSEQFEDIVQNVDIVIDSLDAANVKRSLQVVKDGGTLVSLLAFFDDEDKNTIAARNIRANRLSVESSGADMKSLARFLAEGKMRTHISIVFPFDQLPDAHRQIETRRTVGKIVVTV